MLWADVIIWVMVLLRVGAFLTVFPLLSNAPVRVRGGLAILTAILLAPLLPAVMPWPLSLWGWIALLTKELAVGLLLGFVCRLAFYVIEFAGSVIAMEMGLNMAASLNPFSASRSEAPGLVLYYLGTMLFLTLDLHHWALVAFQRCYEVLPIGRSQWGAGIVSDFVLRTSQLFVSGVLIAAPIIAVSFLINLVFAVFGRAVPQVSIFYESFAFRILGGLVVFGLTLNVMAQHIVNYFRRLPEDLLRVSQILSGG